MDKLIELNAYLDEVIELNLFPQGISKFKIQQYTPRPKVKIIPKLRQKKGPMSPKMVKRVAASQDKLKARAKGIKVKDTTEGSPIPKVYR